MNLDQLKQQHLGWLHNPNTSNGQLADSKTILNLIEELERSAERADKAERAVEISNENFARKVDEITDYRHALEQLCDCEEVGEDRTVCRAHEWLEKCGTTRIQSSAGNSVSERKDKE